MCIVLFIVAYCLVIFYPDNPFDLRGPLLTYPQDPGDESLDELKHGFLPVCPKFPISLQGLVKVSLMPITEAEISYMNPDVRPGGSCVPHHCQARQKIAVVVPYRNRTDHLNVFLNNVHPFLQRQQLDYTIFIVEQAGIQLFNRGKLLNVGFVEALKLHDFECFIFHDVDTIPEEDHNLYTCSQQPTLLSVAMSIDNYRPQRWDYLSGVIAFRKENFAAVNGYPNLYWGWGSEDDDLSERVRHRFGSLPRRHRDIGRYTVFRHSRDPLNPPNPIAVSMAKTTLTRATKDGLNSLHYILIQREKRPLYTWILVEIGRPPSVKRHLTNDTFSLVEPPPPRKGRLPSGISVTYY